VSTAHPVASRTETIRLVGGPSKCGRKPGSSTEPKSARPVKPVGLLVRPKSTCAKIDKTDHREPAVAPLDVPSGAAALRDGPIRPSPESAPRANAPQCRPYASGWYRNRPRPTPARSIVDGDSCRETGAAPLAASSGAMASQHSPKWGSPSSAPRATAPRSLPTPAAAGKAMNAGDGCGLVSPSAGISALGRK